LVSTSTSSAAPVIFCSNFGVFRGNGAWTSFVISRETDFSSWTVRL